MGQEMCALALQIDGDKCRFNEPAKTCDNITFRNENSQDRYYWYHFYYNFAKKGRTRLNDPPLDIMKMRVA